MLKDRINKYTRIFFISIFLAFSAFALYLSFCDAYSYRGGSGKILFISLLFSFIICILWSGNSVWYNIGKLVVNLVVVIIIIKNYKRIEMECGILYQYIKRQYCLYEGLGSISVNKIRTGFSLFGIPVNEKLAMVIAIFMVITVMAVAVLRFRWYFLLMLPAVSIIGMEMFHGKAPSITTSLFLVTGVTGLLFSMKLEMYGGKKNFWQDRHFTGQMPERYSLFMIVLAICFTMSFITGKATSQKVFTYSGKVLKNQRKMEKEAMTFARTVIRRMNNGADGYLDNSSPGHTGKSVMRIETRQKPANNIYIKHFSLDIYENGVWKQFTKSKPPVTETNIDKEAFKSFKKLVSVWADGGLAPDWYGSIKRLNMDIIKDWKFTGEDSFVTYMYNKDKSKPVCFNFSSYAVEDLMAMPVAEMEHIGIKDNKEYTLFVYNNYFEVPYWLSRLKAFADEIITVDDPGLQCAAVKNAICKDTKYSQHLNVLPDGEDYIEYFLFNQKKGYCEHYATAGTILLRMKGVPARYVSGYFIRPSEFNVEHDKSGNEKYVAYVKDYNAHAWTEVYKEGFGWLPFDMTNTVLDDDYNNGADIPSGINVEGQEEIIQDMPLSTTEPVDLSSEENTVQEEPEEEFEEGLEEETDEEDKDNTKVEKGTQQKPVNDNFKIPGKLLLIILLVIFSPLIYIRAGFIKISRKIYLAGTSNKRVVLYFNLLNNYLAFCGLKGLSKLEDTAYAGRISLIDDSGALKGAFGILQQAAFSNNSVNPDDEKTALEFIQDISGMAYIKCSRLRRLIIYVLTGRKRINIFTKVSN